MKEQEVLDYIESISGLGIVPGLDSIKELCRRLGNPQEKLKFVHVAGTNGKGSVSSFVATALQYGGYRVGRYISPTIFEYRERIQVNGRMISKADLGKLMERVKAACDDIVAEGMTQPTPFEVETALGFLYFVEKKCDIVVLEVGMGGRLDATNLIQTPVLTILTSISMDHMKFLGNTLTDIAREKAGIIKSCCPVVSALQEAEALAVIQKTAEEKKCSLQVLQKDDIKKIKYGLEKQTFDFHMYPKLEIHLAGQYQVENAALAVLALEELAKCGYPVREEKLREGFINTSWPGRFQILSRKPYFVVDGAHNEDAAKRLAESIEFYFTNKRIIYIMGVLSDKEYVKIIQLTQSFADQIITITPPGTNRSLCALDLAKEVALIHPNVTAVDSLEEAVEIGYLLAGKEDVIIAFGSLSFQGKMIELVRNRGKNGRSK